MKRLACFGVVARLLFAACGGEAEKPGRAPTAETTGLPTTLKSALSDLGGLMNAGGHASAFISLKPAFEGFWQAAPPPTRSPGWRKGGTRS